MFRLVPGEIVPYNNAKKLVQGVTLQMSYDQLLVERSGYTILDLLSDVGGLQGILTSGIPLLLSILNHSYLNNYLASKLFKSADIAMNIASLSESIKEFCIKLLPSRLVCC